MGHGWVRSVGLVAEMVAIVAAMVLFPNAADAQQPQAGPQPDEMGTLYLGGGQSLTAKEPYLLTKNDDIVDFICAPTGTRIGYVTLACNKGLLQKSIGVVSVDAGDDVTYFRAQGPLDEIGESSTYIDGLIGWSDDAAYLSFTIQGPSSEEPDQSFILPELESVDLVHGSVLTAPLPISQMAPAGSDGAPLRPWEVGISPGAWAPGTCLLAFGLRAVYTNDRCFWGVCLYDPDRQSTRLLAQSEYEYNDDNPDEYAGFAVVGWPDRNHVVYKTPKSVFIYDLATGKSTPAPANARVIRAPRPQEHLVKGITVEAMPGNVEVSLNEASDIFQNSVGSATQAISVSLKRTGGRLKPQTLQIDAFSPIFGIGGDAQFLSNNGFGPAGVYHVVYLSEGDLKKVDLIARSATPEEKLAAGDKLTCDEETPTVMSDARQMGLGILMYAQDHNLTFPAAGDFHDDTYPYLKADGLYTSPNGEPFHYLAPPSLKLGDIEVPAETPLGEFDLPCKKIVLYADGHVRAEDNDQPSSPGGSQ